MVMHSEQFLNVRVGLGFRFVFVYLQFFPVSLAIVVLG